MTDFWRGRSVLVTGGSGFLGSRLCARLRSLGAELRAPRHADCDLVDGQAVRRLFHDLRPEIVIHAAAVVGGIGANRAQPGRFFHDNLMMGVQCMEEARRAGVKKFVAIGTICAYPKLTPVPFREEELWNGYPEETNAPYGLAKKMLLVQAQAYRRQYGFNAIYLLPVNLYGPGDNFHPETSHVIPALVRKFCEAADAGRAEAEVWGSGRATREFLYADDAAEGILLAAERYDGEDPVNLGTGAEISIADLAARIARLAGFRGRLAWDASKPDGQPRRCVDVARAAALFGFRARTPLDEGLRRTVEAYRADGGTTRP